MGVLKVVGFGPGSKEDMSLRAINAIEEADLIMGYTTYVKILKEMFPHKEFRSTGMTREVDRCRAALEEAKDKNVALVSSGDSGIYGMASITYQVASQMDSDVKIEVIPGITAASSAAALLGAPLTHDTALISLSNCLTPWDVIVKRLDAASSSDMVIALYNPRSKARPEVLAEAIGIISKYRPSSTPVGIARNIGRKDQDSTCTTLGELDCDSIDMFCTLIIGNSKTFVENGKMITPRGYDIE